MNKCSQAAPLCGVFSIYVYFFIVRIVFSALIEKFQLFIKSTGNCCRLVGGIFPHTIHQQSEICHVSKDNFHFSNV